MQCFGRIFVDLAEPQQYEPHEQICCDGRRVLATNLGSMQMTMKWPKPNLVLGFSWLRPSRLAITQGTTWSAD